MGQPPQLFQPRTTRVSPRRRHCHCAHCHIILGRLIAHLTPLVGEAGERPAGQYAPRKCPYYPDHALYQRRGRRAILPRCCPPPACRRPPPPRHPYPTSPLHRLYRRNGHPLLLVVSILIGGTAALDAPCRRLHLRHHAAPSVEHRNGDLVASGYQVKRISWSRHAETSQIREFSAVSYSLTTSPSITGGLADSLSSLSANSGNNSSISSNSPFS